MLSNLISVARLSSRHLARNLRPSIAHSSFSTSSALESSSSTKKLRNSNSKKPEKPIQSPPPSSASSSASVDLDILQADMLDPEYGATQDFYNASDSEDAYHSKMQQIFAALPQSSTAHPHVVIPEHQPIPHTPAPLNPEEIPWESILKIFVVSASPNFFLPWQSKPQKESTGSGFIISGRRILTNAHVVADQAFVQVRKGLGNPDKYIARVLAVGHDCDLALLTVENEEFWANTVPLEISDIPELQEQVNVVGFPVGGDSISISSGVVSRVEQSQYAHGASTLLTAQIDAAINPGNSGGPCMGKDGRVVGVAFQNLTGADNIGYIIPSPIVRHFLQDAAKGKYSGFPALGISCQALENSQLRSALMMSPGQTGVLINSIQPLAPAASQFKRHDVIMSIDGLQIANDGSVLFRRRERVPFDYVIQSKFSGDTVKLVILRDGVQMEVCCELQPIDHLVAVHQFDVQPSYFVCAGLVFAKLTQPFLHEFGEDWYSSSPRKLCDLALNGIKRQKGEEVVVLTQVLGDEINVGYGNMSDLRLLKFNGIQIQSLRQLRDLVVNCREPWMRFELEEDRLIVLSTHDALASNDRILRRHKIPHQMSSDLQESTEAK